MDHLESRRKKLRRLLKKNHLPALLISTEENVTYLTGFTGDSTYLLFTSEEEILLSDARYTEQISQEAPGMKAEIRGTGETLSDILQRLLETLKLNELGVEGANLSIATFNALQKKCEGVELLPQEGLVEELRQIKDKTEIAIIRAAVEVAERAFGVVRAGLRPEQTEKEVADIIEYQVRLFGGSCTSFPPIVAAGPQSALPHATPTSMKLGESPFILFDWGARVDGYCSDMTRMVFTDRVPKKMEKIYKIVLEAHEKAVAAIKPGIDTDEVDHIARKHITDAGFGEAFGHSLGHGIGLQIHEGPTLSKRRSQELKPGMIVTVEPGIYLPGSCGVRIEDDILVTRKGHENLTSLPKSFESAFV
ncbi:Xaa-Pro aminopeptidase [Planctomycetales bacterium 10988]|nr:Xaa-Pro aminopeptidase [Planctomycetales bacterium 10988]